MTFSPFAVYSFLNSLLVHTPCTVVKVETRYTCGVTTGLTNVSGTAAASHRGPCQSHAAFKCHDSSDILSSDTDTRLEVRRAADRSLRVQTHQGVDRKPSAKVYKTCATVVVRFTWRICSSGTLKCLHKRSERPTKAQAARLLRRRGQTTRAKPPLSQRKVHRQGKRRQSCSMYLFQHVGPVLGPGSPL